MALLTPLVLPPTVLGYYLLMVIGARGPIGRLLSRWDMSWRLRGARQCSQPRVGSFALLAENSAVRVSNQ